ncbi:hypothetical protein [Colwellia piezophila]|uniref:hypothetical protein n=1 Tax=Colwellia piezophila TaxID=211668 RepID=UPI000365FA2E|nr:hypothetical protein [Colwellia piezophila]
MYWTTTTTPKIHAAIIVAGAMAFNTCIATDEFPVFDSDEVTLEVNNLHGAIWRSTNAFTKQPADKKAQEVIGVSDVIKVVKVALGLPNKDVAQIFGVTRQTVHNYMKQSSINHAVNADTLERTQFLNEIFQKLSTIFEKSPGAMAKNFTIQGESLLNLLSKSDLNIDQISSFAYQLSKRMAENNLSSNAMDSDVTLAELTRHT